MKVEVIELPTLSWPEGAAARMWFCQPRVPVTSQPPFRPTNPEHALGILRAVLNADAAMGPQVDGGPSIVLLPELSVGCADVQTIREIIQTSRPNTLVICGVGHMEHTDVEAIEASAPLCGPPVVGRYANCAMVACGASDRVYLQPKIVPSREELDYHWPGLIVRYFLGRAFPFVVFVCSEMLDRASAKTTISHVVDQLRQQGRQLSAVFWLQHNPKPRSLDFSESLEQLARFDRPTTFVVGSREPCPPRFEHYAVSGALCKKTIFPKNFNVLTRRFHYVEPVLRPSVLSRAVLLRYDADVNRVDTVLANAIDEDSRTERSQLFGSVTPLVLENGVLVDSATNLHLAEICERARRMASATNESLTAFVQLVVDELVGLGTTRFQEFLDRAIVPRPPDNQHRHPAGQQHPGGDYDCNCWKHRECIDLLSDRDDAAEPLAHVLFAIGNVLSQGMTIELVPAPSAPSNIRVSSQGRQFNLCVVFPFDLAANATEEAILGGPRPRSAAAGYIVLGTAGRSGRPELAGISQAVAQGAGAINPANATSPRLKAVYADEFRKSIEDGTLEQLLVNNFG